MESRKKKKLLNVLMVAIIVLIAVCGVMTVGNVKGWFENGSGSYAAADDISGIVDIERKGVSYSLDEETALRDGDIVTTASDSYADIHAGDNTFSLAEDTELSFGGIEEKLVSTELKSGETFAVIEGSRAFEKATVSDWNITAEEAVFSANVRKGSIGINVFEGRIKVTGSGTEKIGKAGQMIDITDDEISVSKLTAASLNDFNIENAKKANENHQLCFSNEKLDQVVADREKEIQKALEEQKTHEKQVISAGTATDGSGSPASSDSESGSEESDSSIKQCTIMIQCGAVLKNMDALSPGKEKFVPSNGVILSASTVEFREGETVFDVLKRTCSAAGIQLEYAYTPGYGSYYVEGINNLYEFDCGSQSGWIYKVNGWSANCGCSEYKLKKNDVIVWDYTCKGIGADVGAGM